MSNKHKKTDFNKTEKEQFLEGIRTHGIFDFKNIKKLVPTKTDEDIKEYIKLQIQEAGLFKLTDDSEYVVCKPQNNDGKRSNLDNWMYILQQKKTALDKKINIPAVTMKIIGDLLEPSGTPEHFKECRDIYKIIADLLYGHSLPTNISESFIQTTSNMALKIVLATKKDEADYFKTFTSFDDSRSLTYDRNNKLQQGESIESPRLKVAKNTSLNPFQIPPNLLLSSYTATTKKPASFISSKNAETKLIKNKPMQNENSNIKLSGAININSKDTNQETPLIDYATAGPSQPCSSYNDCVEVYEICDESSDGESNDEDLEPIAKKVRTMESLG